MNIFVVDNDPHIAASMLCDVHVIKMVTESAQMLSTTHRLLDGVPKLVARPGKKPIKRWILPDIEFDTALYQVAHQSHPCTIWCMKSLANYNWLVSHYVGLSREYTRRYGKQHAAFYKNRIGTLLTCPPTNIASGKLTTFAIAMKQYPECIIPGDAVASYRKYYNVAKARFAKWKLGNVPNWYTSELVDA